jgi:hypothetical protein
MADDNALQPVCFPETAAKGYFVHARFQDQQLMTPAPHEFYVEIETALAVGICWLNERCYIDPKAMKVSGIKRRREELLALAIQFRGVPQCGVLVAKSGFEAPPREKDAPRPCDFEGWWKTVTSRFKG